MAVSMNFYLALLLRKLFQSDFTSSNFLLKNSSIVKQFLPTFQRKRYHQPGECIHKVNIADGSIPIKNFLRNNGSKIATFVLAIAFASRKPLDI
jgi:hypothetical protein